MCHRWHMAARKPDSLVGPLGVWAYDTARSLDLSAAQVAAAAHVHEATIRKIEGGSNRDPSQELVYRMHRYFQEVAEQEGRTAPPPPTGWLDRKPQPAPSDIVEAIDRQTRMLAAVLEAIVARLPTPVDELATTILDEVQGTVLPGRTPTPPQTQRPDRVGGR